MSHATYGEPVALGTCIGYALEPGERLGRLVGIRHNETPIHTYVIREYVPGDGWFPTGGYHTTSLFGLIPASGDGGRVRRGPDGDVQVREGRGIGKRPPSSA